LGLQQQHRRLHGEQWGNDRCRRDDGELRRNFEYRRNCEHCGNHQHCGIHKCGRNRQWRCWGCNASRPGWRSRGWIDGSGEELVVHGGQWELHVLLG
jgi:hypothetical protein